MDDVERPLHLQAAMTGGTGQETTAPRQMVTRVGPLVDRLQRFWRAHESGDGAAVATEFRIWLEGVWPDVTPPRPKIEFEDPPAEDPRKDMDEIVVELLRGVGEIAEFLLGMQDPRVELAWVREHMLERLEIYEHLSGRAGDGSGGQTTSSDA